MYHSNKLYDFSLRTAPLKHLPKLYSSTEGLNLSGCYLNYIKSLPPRLKLLDLSGNYNLKSLPYLPDSLEVLIIKNCRIEELPNLPKNLRVFNCSYSSFRKLFNPKNCEISTFIAINCFNLSFFNGVYGFEDYLKQYNLELLKSKI